MKLKKVVDEYGTEHIVDEETRKMYSYCNKEHWIIYNAQIIENGVRTMFWANYTESGTVEPLEERLHKFGNRLMAIYAKRVDYSAAKNDPDRAIWREFVEKIRKREDVFFTKDGDFRKCRRHKK